MSVEEEDLGLSSSKRKSARLIKKPKLLLLDEDYFEDDTNYDIDQDYETIEHSKPRTGAKRGRKRKNSTPAIPIEYTDCNTGIYEENGPSPYDHGFVQGTYIVSKKDKTNLNSKDLLLWKIDSRVLLQKFEGFYDKDGSLKFASTSVYTGWTTLDKDDYFSVSINIYESTPKRTVIEIVHNEHEEVVTLDSE